MSDLGFLLWNRWDETKKSVKLKIFENLAKKLDLSSNEKVESAFWSGVFYKEVELYRKLLSNCPETDASSTTAKYEHFLHEAIAYYEQLISS